MTVVNLATKGLYIEINCFSKCACVCDYVQMCVFAVNAVIYHSWQHFFYLWNYLLSQWPGVSCAHISS